MGRNWSEAQKVCRDHLAKVDGRWCRCKGKSWRYRMGFPDAETGAIGVPRWSPTYPDKETADAEQRKLRQAIADGRYRPDRGLTLGAWLDQWIDRKQTEGRSPLTIVGYRQITETWLKPTLGRHRLSGLAPHHVQALIDRAAKSPSHRRHGPTTPPTPGTLVNIRACLRAALSDAERAELVTRNVARLVTLPKVERTSKAALTRDQLRAFRERVEADELGGLWHVAMFCGPRRGELAGMTERRCRR